MTPETIHLRVTTDTSPVREALADMRKEFERRIWLTRAAWFGLGSFAGYFSGIFLPM